jgi:hypothetical protein
VLQRSPRRAGEGRGLDVGQHRGQVVRAEHGDGDADGALIADARGGRDEQLRSVGLDHRLGRSGARAAEPREGAGPVGQHHDVVPVHGAVDDPSLVEPYERTPDIRHQLVRDLVLVDGVEPLAVSQQDEDGVFVRHASGHDRLDGDPASLGEQREEGFVFHLLEPAQRDARRVVAVPEVRPHRVQQLAVPRVAPVVLHEQRASVERARLHQRDATGRERGFADGSDVDPEVRERGLDLVRRRPAARRADRQVDDRGGPVPEGETDDHAEQRR